MSISGIGGGGGYPRPAERCTSNTDKVDREIAQLRRQKQQLEQQLKQAEDPRQREALQKRLEAVEQQLQQKDNDAYRRQHAEFS